MTRMAVTLYRLAVLVVVIALTSPAMGWSADTLKAAAKKEPKDAKAQALLGRAYSYRGDDDKADAAYARAAELAPDNAEYQFMLGSSLARAEKTTEALAAFRRAAELNPKHAKTALMVGVMLADTGDEDGALEWFAKAAKLDPKYALAHGNIGQIHQNRGHTKEALAAFQRAVEARPDDWRFRSKLVQLHQALGQIEERDHERAVVIDLWREDKVDQPMFCREQFEVDGKQVQAYEHFELEGDRAVRYAFMVLKPGGTEVEFKISLGSYDMTTRIAREQGEVGKDER